MKRTDWLIAGFLAVLFLFVVGGLMVYWLQSNAYANLPTEITPSVKSGILDDVGVTARQAIESSAVLAKDWQADAVVVSASATILQFSDLQAVYSGKASWSVVYFSPSTSSVATFTINATGSSFLNEKKIDIVPKWIAADGIELDSGNAMAVALSNGGINLLTNEDAERVVSLAIRPHSDTGQAEWQVFIQNESTGAFLNFQIDALSGEIIEKAGL